MKNILGLLLMTCWMTASASVLTPYGYSEKPRPTAEAAMKSLEKKICKSSSRYQYDKTIDAIEVALNDLSEAQRDAKNSAGFETDKEIKEKLENRETAISQTNDALNVYWNSLLVREMEGTNDGKKVVGDLCQKLKNVSF